MLFQTTTFCAPEVTESPTVKLKAISAATEAVYIHKFVTKGTLQQAQNLTSLWGVWKIGRTTCSVEVDAGAQMIRTLDTAIHVVVDFDVVRGVKAWNGTGTGTMRHRSLGLIAHGHGEVDLAIWASRLRLRQVGLQEY